MAFDPILVVFTKILEKHLGNILTGMDKLHLLTEIRRVSFGLISGSIELDEARSHIKDLLDILVSDTVDDEIKNEVIEEIMKALRVEVNRSRIRISRRGFLSPST